MGIDMEERAGLSRTLFLFLAWRYEILRIVSPTRAMPGFTILA